MASVRFVLEKRSIINRLGLGTSTLRKSKWLPATPDELTYYRKLAADLGMLLEIKG